MMRPAYRYRMEVVRVIDGDTLVARIDCGFRVWIVTPVRVLGWSAPELREPGGPEAKVACERLLGEAAQIIIETETDAQTFGRWLGRVWLSEGVELGAALAALGLARPGR